MNQAQQQIPFDPKLLWSIMRVSLDPDKAIGKIKPVPREYDELSSEGPMFSTTDVEGLFTIPKLNKRQKKTFAGDLYCLKN